MSEATSGQDEWRGEGHRAVVLLSGGLDSATALAIARASQDCYCLSVDYGQRHRFEMEAAKRVAEHLGAREHRVVEVDLRSIGGSALTDEGLDVPRGRGVEEMGEGIPVTYVPARNLIFMSIAAGYAEVIGARDIYVGVNAVDYSGYPDCRPAFIEAFEKTANLATKVGVESEGRGLRVHAPLLWLSKGQIIQRGMELGVDYSLTHSCYDPDDAGAACGMCDACVLRRKGFEDAGVADPTRYRDTR